MSFFGRSSFVRRFQNMFVGAQPKAPVNVSSLYSTITYVGDGIFGRTLAGVDMSRGGIVFITNDTTAGLRPEIWASPDGVSIYRIATNGGNLQGGDISNVYAFTSAGLTFTGSLTGNAAGQNYTAYFFAKSPRFVDVVSYIGDGSSVRAIPHSLQVAPGLFFTDQILFAGQASRIYTNVRGANFGTQFFGGNTFDYSANPAGRQAWANSPPNDSYFYVGYTTNDNNKNNRAGERYFVALFADDPASDGACRVVPYTGDAAVPGQIFNLGWQPQFLMWQQTPLAGGTDGLVCADAAHGFGAATSRGYLAKNLARNTTWGQPAIVGATGFQLNSADADVNAAGVPYACVAIRQP